MFPVLDLVPSTIEMLSFPEPYDPPLSPASSQSPTMDTFPTDAPHIPHHSEEPTSLGYSPSVVEPSVPESSQAPSMNLRRSSRPSKPPLWLQDYVTQPVKSHMCVYPISSCVSYDTLKPAHIHALSSYSSLIEPKSFGEAATSPKWIKVVKLEIASLEDNHTWSIVDLPTGKRPIGCNLIFKIKFEASGEVERYKARSVAKGYSQKEGLDYTEIFSHVAKMVTVRTIIALAAAKKWVICQMDVHNAFLNGDLLEEVYIHIPDGFARQGSLTRSANYARPYMGSNRPQGNGIRKCGFTADGISAKPL